MLGFVIAGIIVAIGFGIYLIKRARKNQYRSASWSSTTGRQSDNWSTSIDDLDEDLSMPSTKPRSSVLPAAAGAVAGSSADWASHSAIPNDPIPPPNDYTKPHENSSSGDSYDSSIKDSGSSFSWDSGSSLDSGSSWDSGGSGGFDSGGGFDSSF